jgi:hypothetical protein
MNNEYIDSLYPTKLKIKDARAKVPTSASYLRVLDRRIQPARELVLCMINFVN